MNVNIHQLNVSVIHLISGTVIMNAKRTTCHRHLIHAYLLLRTFSNNPIFLEYCGINCRAKHIKTFSSANMHVRSFSKSVGEILFKTTTRIDI